MADAATLRALAERVEAGERPQIETRDGRSFACADLSESKIKADLLFVLAATFPQNPLIACEALWSLDACAALHEAVLGDAYDWVVGPQTITLSKKGQPSVSSTCPTPARAWLAAILRAKAAEMEADE